MMHRKRFIWILASALLIGCLLLPGPSWPARAQAGSQADTIVADSGHPLHGAADYDSGWTAVAANNSTAFYHYLGGDTDDYVVDIQFWDKNGTAGDAGVHHWGHGSDWGDQIVGVYWQDLTDTTITIVRTMQDILASAVRVRIWVAPQADYDSGWHTLPLGQDLTVYHYLGGDTDDYVVDMQFRSSNPAQGVNQLHYGGNLWGGNAEGAFWHSLGTMTIKVHRNADDTAAAAEARVRIWRKPNPDYDSDWLLITDHLTLLHWLGGPWSDFVVDLQFKDSSDGYGVNQFGYGGDTVPGLPPKVNGAYWLNLTGSGIEVRRGDDDIAADRVRVRIWSSRIPKYDSGWTALDQGAGKTLAHNLGGIPDTYAMDVQFRDTDADGISTAGVNQRYYGGDTWYNHGTSSHENYGVWWHHLEMDSVFLYRFGNDSGADEVRVRLWVAPMPAYDSGWQSIAGSLTLDHNLGGSPSDYVVDLQFLDDTATAPQGVNHGRYGGDTYVEDGTTPRGLGAYWQGLTATSVTVTRLADAAKVDKVRVRIWRNPSFDYASSWMSVSTVRTFNHNLNTCADGLVVDFQFQSDGSHGTHQRHYGGNNIYFGQLYQYGAHWQALTGRSVEVYRHSSDLEVDRARVRVWVTPGCRVFLPLVLRP